MSNESPYRDDSGKRPSTDPPHVLRSEPAVSRPSFDDIFKLLSEKRRRYAIHYLSSTPDGFAALSDLVEQVAAWETETMAADVPDDYRRRVEASLHHTHLPKLDDVNIIDYDARSESVRYWGQPVLEEYAEHVAAMELPER
ncbi:DUF7344 domain-containing protein [Haladaptatus caseinilyticus]|uniref:DUF7344 domain-containing protein n=1 Tax=Haladaptatus caseinilyticus TaxID=2993314 RepID=UPI00224AB322|nr:hypothetical protein [Haladaptatus caseinilyticus]